MTCPENTNLDHRIISFNSEHVLNGDYSASVLLSDTYRLDDPTNVAEGQPCGTGVSPIKVAVEIENQTDPISPQAYGEDVAGEDADLTNCLAEAEPPTPPAWVYGLKYSYDLNIDEGTANISVRSFFEHMKGRAVSTQQFRGTDIKTVFDVLFQYYLGIPQFLFNIVDYSTLGVWDEDTILGPIEGADTYAELQALCTAVGANLFVQTDGRLTIEKWKDHNSPVEYAIPSRLIISADPSGYERGRTTVVRARGAALGMMDCGDQVLTNNDDTDGSSKKGSMKKSSRFRY